MVDGVNNGIHGVLVRIRDDDGNVMPGFITVPCVFILKFFSNLSQLISTSLSLCVSLSLVLSLSLDIIAGVTIHDMGYKMGLNGIDNAKISFDNVRVPRENLLNKESEVNVHFRNIQINDIHFDETCFRLLVDAVFTKKTI